MSTNLNAWAEYVLDDLEDRGPAVRLELRRGSACIHAVTFGDAGRPPHGEVAALLAARLENEPPGDFVARAVFDAPSPDAITTVSTVAKEEP